MKQDMRTSEQEGFIAELAIKLAEFDGLDEDSMFQLQWSGGSAPEPLGDAFSMDYLPRAEQLFLVIQQHSQQEINKYKSYYDAVLDHCAISHLPEKETPYQTIGSLCDFHSEIALDPRVSPEALAKQQELDAARLEVERLRDLIGLSYGYLWHVNNEHGTPQRFYPPERAAYEARKLLRDTLTHEQRGQYINSVRELIDEALAAQQEKG